MFKQEVPELFVKGYHRHYKGDKYFVEDIVVHSETEEWMVLYRPCYGEALLWVRPYSMFYENVIDNEGREVKRFTPVDE